MSGEDQAVAAVRDGHEDAARTRVEGDALRGLARLARVPGALADVSLREAARPARYLAAVMQLDDETRALLPGIISSGLSAASERNTVATARDVFGALLDAYRACAMSYRSGLGGQPAAEPAVCRIRLVRAAADRVKWERCAGGPAHRRLWQWIASEFRSVVAGGAPDAVSRSIRSDDATVAREYLRAVTHSTLPLDRLGPAAVETVDLLVEFSLPMIQFQPSTVSGATYFSPPDFASPPRRIVRPDDGGPAAWHFSSRTAAKAVGELTARPDDDPTLRKLVERAGAQAPLRAALGFLQRQWSDVVPTRRFRRHLLDGRLKAVRGIDELCRVFSGEARPRWSEWTFHDASRGGLGVFAPLQPGFPPRVGELVGVRSAEGGAFQLAVVRRTWIETESSVFVGLETLSQSPVLVSADDGRDRAAVLLCEPMRRGEIVRVVAPSHALRPGVPLFVTGRGAVQKLKSLGVGATGEGYELLVYQVL